MSSKKNTKKKLVVSFSGHIEIPLDRVKFYDCEFEETDLSSLSDKKILDMLNSGEASIDYTQVISDRTEDSLEASDFAIRKDNY